MNEDLTQRYQRIKTQIAELAQEYARSEPLLLAVSKKQPADSIEKLYHLGQRDFGESYWQETEQKISDLKALDIVWHFIGPLQSNKTRPIAENMDWVHSVDRLKIAQRLNDQRPSHLPPLNICLQVNLDDEASKSGASIADVKALAPQVAALPRLNLRGLMCIPKRQPDFQQQRATFAKLAQIQEQLNGTGLHLDTLSMGMSDDMAAAIAEGSTMVRIGTALFGARKT